MAGILKINGVAFGEIRSSNFEPDFPVMDTDYMNVRLTFNVDKTFDNAGGGAFIDWLNFNKNDIDTFFNNRTKAVAYESRTVSVTYSNYFLVSIKPGPIFLATDKKVIAEYTLVFTKEDA